MAEDDKCGNCERSLATKGCTKNVCVAPKLPRWISATLLNRVGEVDPENTDVCDDYKRMHGDHGGGND